jgi:hypothetical protein
MITKGTVIDVREDGTAIIKTSINVAEFIRKEIKECYVDLIDSRPLSDKQRKMCYALINAIGEWSGQDTQDLKEYFKMKFWADKVDTLADKVFSLSNAPVSLVREFQKFLINFVLENDVPTKKPLYEYVDDIDNYVYMCLIHKKCAVCGTKKNVELNHVDTIGMGNDRTEVQHEGREAISLCKEHHQEYHTIGKQTFFEKYHFNGGVKIDRTLLKIYKLKR